MGPSAAQAVVRGKEGFVAKQSCLLDGPVIKSAPVGPVNPNQKTVRS